MTPKTAAKKTAERAPSAVPYFNFRRLSGGRVLISNDSGSFAELSGADFTLFCSGRLKPGALRSELEAKGFVRDMMDFDGLASAASRRNAFLNSGPGLHILVMTLRCNHKCLYCQSSAVGADGGRETDMSRKVARRSVDFALQSPAQGITIEFQGGEPLLNWDTLSDTVLYARAAAKKKKKEVRLALVSNFSLMTEAKAKFLLENEVSICTSLDGPAPLHNANRVYACGNSHASTERWLKYFSDKAARQSPDFKVFRPSALLTVTRASLSQGRKIVDEYVRFGLEDVFLRPLAPIGFASRLWPKIGYTPQEFSAFYRSTLEYILKLNAAGTKIRERNAVILLEKMLNGSDPGFLDLRCPCGAAIGQVAYNYNGDLYTCDEGRMVGWQGNDLFKAGNVLKDSYRDVILSPAARACAAASTLDSQPQCSRCAYKPYCGVCPVYNYETQGSLWGDMASSGRCSLHLNLFDTLAELLRKPASAAILKGWVAK